MLRYLDSSALVKLVVREPETDRLLDHLAAPSDEIVSSTLSSIEVKRAVARAGIGNEAAERVDGLLASIDLRSIDDAIIRAAAALEPPTVHTLDAIHLATAIELAGEVEELIAYDQRLLDAATQNGIAAVAP